MKKYMERDKLMSASDAISRFAKDGDSFVFANCLYAMPLALTHELIRQKKKNMMVFQQGGIEEIDQLVSAGTVDRIILAYNFRVGGKRIISPLDRAIKEKSVAVEEMTNLTLLSMLKAGAMGYPFMPVMNGIRVTDVVRRKGLLGDKRFAEVVDPFSGESVLVVKGYSPDFALVHVQRADRLGNAQLWGAMINSKWAALAANKVIVSTEEIVDTEVVKSSPHLTIIPAHKVCAVVHCPWGAHPSEVAGCYDYDMPFRALFFSSASDPEMLKGWLDEWIFDLPDRTAYIKHYIERFGVNSLNSLRAKSKKSTPADYGSTFKLVWDENSYSNQLGMSMDEFVTMLDDRGLMIDGN